MNTEKFTQSVPMERVRLADSFWSRFMETVRTKLIPYQWEALNDRVEGAAPSHCIRNFRIAAGLEQGEFGGKVFQDSDIAKWLEAVAYSLIQYPDPELEKTADGAIDLIVSAQQPDGYLNTYYIINGLEKRWSNLRDNHELYCAGHMIEAAVAYYRATGKRRLLDAVIRYADYIDTVFGAEDGKLHGYPGHEVIEMALMKLYGVTEDEKYKRLAEYFINQRGRQPLYFEQEAHDTRKKWEDFYMKYKYAQTDRPVRQQTEAAGHAVRAVYLYSGMADVAKAAEDDGLYEALKKIWNSLTRRRMYITGSIGSSHFGEAFTFDYDLPNDTIYAETCAAVGLAFLAKRMLGLEARGEYGDVLERTLYNGVISGMTLDGTRFFYVNPLEVVPEASLKDENKRHVRPERQKWFGTACCPPNLARLVSSLPDYIYGTGGDTVYVHLYAGNTAKIALDGQDVCLVMETNYPWEETVKLQVNPEKSQTFRIALRIPGWCRKYSVSCNGQPVQGVLENGYYYIQRCWQEKDQLELRMEMPVELVQANPKVRENVGKAALMRGPVVYCLEEADNGADLHRIRLQNDGEYRVQYEPEMLGGVVTIRGEGQMLQQNDWSGDELYAVQKPAQYQKKQLLWIPYYAWANRSAGELLVWIRKE